MYFPLYDEDYRPSERVANNKRYIGISEKTLKQRVKEHKNEKNKSFMRTHGVENWKFKVLTEQDLKIKG